MMKHIVAVSVNVQIICIFMDGRSWACMLGCGIGMAEDTTFVCAVFVVAFHVMAFMWCITSTQQQLGFMRDFVAAVLLPDKCSQSKVEARRSRPAEHASRVASVEPTSNEPVVTLRSVDEAPLWNEHNDNTGVVDLDRESTRTYADSHPTPQGGQDAGDEPDIDRGGL